ncbi:Small ubiquitin-related modifier 1 [Psilocybe cubensis]|uniref:Small ubiquitin-related modifier 1 n=2 Tax=Psilocybe cubensis TaxID=181762 RepID=A0ACB8HE50_PSICU|nr:Small ubiquitin-related modifier 1 [Psilocybe cubensis]KAH9486280.1 Small ubiquitin-related modifier 1 [Psilocybe cubensis]
MNTNDTSTPQHTAPPPRQPKPPPAGPAPPAPATAPPAPPNQTNNVNGHHPPPAQTSKGKKRNDVPIDPATMYESLKNRIAALEEEEVLEEEEERRFAEEAQKSVKGLEENAIHSKYIELFAELKRMERDHSKEKQKLVKDKDAAKGQLTKANQTKTKMENLARELQKDNKRLREDGKRLAQSVEEAQEELARMKSDFAKRADKAKQQDVKYREMPDIVVKVVCRYRAELFFKISRKTKLSRLINSWTERMERSGGGEDLGSMNGSAKTDAASTHYSGSTGSSSGMQFIFTYNGRMLEAEQTPEEIGIDEGDEIVAVEMMDLTEGGGGSEEWEEHVEPRREKLKKNWTDNPQEARRTIEEIFDGVVRERLKEVLRQYELRERHFECVIRSKELEVLLSRARAAEQKQLAEGEKARSSKQEEENQQLRKDLEDAQNGQTMLIDKLITCCKEIIQKPNAERTQRLFASLREELERKNPRGAKKPVDGSVGG